MNFEKKALQNISRIMPILEGEPQSLESCDVSGQFEDSEDPHDSKDLSNAHHFILVTVGIHFWTEIRR